MIDHNVHELTNHQTVHFFSGFMGVPDLQLKASEKALELDNAPFTLKQIELISIDH